MGLIVSVLFTVVFLVGLHPEELRQVPRQLVPELVLLSAAVLFLEFPLRALRWCVLLSPLHHKHHGPSTGCPLGLGRLFSITTIGFMANNVLPARAGEFVRPYLAARDGRLPFEAVLVTAVLERGFDVLGLATVAALTLLLLPGSGAATMDSVLLSELTRWAWLLAGLAVAGLAGLCLVALKHTWFRPLVHSAVKVLPESAAQLVMRIFDGALGGLSSLEIGWRPVAAASITAVIWVNGSVAIWVLMHAFQLDLPFAAACFLSLTIALAVVLPQAPGFIGVFQVATQATLVAWGVNLASAQGFAIMFWLVSFVPVTVSGLLALWARGLNLRRLASQAAEQTHPSEHPLRVAAEPLQAAAEREVELSA